MRFRPPRDAATPGHSGACLGGVARFVRPAGGPPLRAPTGGSEIASDIAMFPSHDARAPCGARVARASSGGAAPARAVALDPLVGPAHPCLLEAGVDRPHQLARSQRAGLGGQLSHRPRRPRRPEREDARADVVGHVLALALAGDDERRRGEDARPTLLGQLVGPAPETSIAPHARRDRLLQRGRPVVDHRRRLHLDADRERRATSRAGSVSRSTVVPSVSSMSRYSAERLVRRWTGPARS